MHRHGEWLHQRRLLEWHRIWQAMQHRRGHDHKLGESTVDVASQVAGVGTQLVVTRRQ
jgi:hypothetical protein